MINAGAMSYASYRVKGVMAELAQYDPDLFIAYMGHNEFLERRTYADVLRTPSLLRDAAGLASGLRIATLMSSGLEQVGILGAVEKHHPTGLHAEVVRIPVYAVGPEAYSRNETFKREVLAHYEASLSAMIDLATAARARTLFVTPVSNLRDFAPFKSENRGGLTSDQLNSWRTDYEKGRLLARNSQFTEADRQFDAALAIDDSHADLLYRKGQTLLALGKDQEAMAYLTRARDEDICPLRALTATSETMRRVAARRGVALLDFERLATLARPTGFPAKICWPTTFIFRSRDRRCWRLIFSTSLRTTRSSACRRLGDRRQSPRSLLRLRRASMVRVTRANSTVSHNCSMLSARPNRPSSAWERGCC